MTIRSRLTQVLVLFTMLALLSGCASPHTDATGAGGAPEARTLARATLTNAPSTVPLGQFPKVEIIATQISPPYQGEAPADQVAKILDQQLPEQLEKVFGFVKTVGRGGEFRPGRERTLLITPRIVDAKLVSSLERTWLTWAAGDSWLFVKVDFVDSSSGAVVADPVFFAKAEAFWASFDNGIKDVEIITQLTEEVTRYAKANK